MNLEVMERAAGLLVRDFEAHGLVGSVAEQPAFAGMDGIEKAFSREFPTFEDGEAARVEREL